MSLRDVPYRAQYVSGVDKLVRDFYIPTLNQSVLYQRRTAYFNSRALAMAARGLGGLLKNGGRMQLLCSVQLDASEQAVLTDPQAYAERIATDVAEMLNQPYDELEKQRFALLAKLLETGRLEIKIAVRRGGIYHEKAGIFKDRDGNIVAFNGSGNETPGGWVNNTESFQGSRGPTLHVQRHPAVELRNGRELRLLRQFRRRWHRGTRERAGARLAAPDRSHHLPGAGVHRRDRRERRPSGHLPRRGQ